jgi:hypothetical protein
MKISIHALWSVLDYDISVRVRAMTLDVTLNNISVIS